MLHLSLLNLKQINRFFPDPQDRQCESTNFAVLLGAAVKESGNCEYWTEELYNVEKRTEQLDYLKVNLGYNLFKTSRRPVVEEKDISLTSALEEVSPMVVNDDGSLGWDFPNMRDKAIRIVISANDFYSQYPEAKKVQVGQSFQSNLEYPQTVVSKFVTNNIKLMHRLIKTGKEYVVDSGESSLDEKNYNRKFSPRTLDEIIVNGEKYVEVEATPYDSSSKILIDGQEESVVPGKPYFVKVEKVNFTKYQYAANEDYFVSDMALLAGIQIDTLKEYLKVYNENNYAHREVLNLSSHNIGEYLNTFMAKNLLPVAGYEKEKKSTLYFNNRLSGLKVACATAHIGDEGRF